MHRDNYIILRDRFIEGRSTKPSNYTKWRAWIEGDHFDVVSVPDIMRLYHKKSRTSGILTHIGANIIGIRSDNGSLIEDDFQNFFYVDDAGYPLQEVVFDILGNPISIGDWVFHCYRKQLRIGRVSKFTPIGTVMVDAISPLNNRRIKSRAASGSSCVLVPTDHDKVQNIKELLDKN